MAAVIPLSHRGIFPSRPTLPLWANWSHQNAQHTYCKLLVAAVSCIPAWNIFIQISQHLPVMLLWQWQWQWLPACRSSRWLRQQVGCKGLFKGGTPGHEAAVRPCTLRESNQAGNRNTFKYQGGRVTQKPAAVGLTGCKNPFWRWLTSLGGSFGGSRNPTRPAVMVITCGMSLWTEALLHEAEVADTGEMLSSSSGSEARLGALESGDLYAID